MTPLGVILVLGILGSFPFPPFPFSLADDSYQVVFEDVGQVATSVSYLHIAIDLHFPEVKTAIDDYKKVIDGAFAAIAPFSFPDNHPYVEILWRPIMRNYTADFFSLRNQFHTRHQNLVKRYDHISSIMPFTAKSATDAYSIDDVRFRRATRVKRFLPLVILKGAVGTLMGLYNRHQTKKLREILDTTVKEQKRLLITDATQTYDIKNLQSAYNYLPSIVSHTNLMGPMLLLVRLLEIEMMIDVELHRIADSVQQAQHRRLSITTLTNDKLRKAFNRIVSRTKELKMELLIEQPSDLFQIEVSYFFDGEDISLLLHVPMAAPNSLLRLQRFLPFPLSFTNTHFLLPRPPKNLFAISSGEPRLSLELNEADLEGCYRLNSLHLCERLGVLSKKTDRSCLGALYTQDFDRATELCRMDVVAPSERVLQLGNNRYLVYALQSFTAHITCRNFTANEHHFKAGINRVQVSPSCSISLQDHVIYADSALEMDNQIREISWSPSELEMNAAEVQDVQESIMAAEEDGEATPTLAELNRRSGHRRRWVGWTLFFVLLILLAIVIAALWVFGFISTHKWWLLKKSVQLIRDQVADAASRFAHDRFGRSLPAAPFAPPPVPRHRSDRTCPPPNAPTEPRYAISSPEGTNYAVEPATTTPVPHRASSHRRRRGTSTLITRGRQMGHRELARLLTRLQTAHTLEPVH